MNDPYISFSFQCVSCVLLAHTECKILIDLGDKRISLGVQLEQVGTGKGHSHNGREFLQQGFLFLFFFFCSV